MPRSRTLAVALGVVLGGLLLGSVIGSAADPELKTPAERASPAARGSEPASDPSENLMVEFAPYPDRYPPPFADEVITDWTPDYPAWTYSDFDSDSGSDLGGGAAEEPAEPERRPAEGPALPAEPRIAGGLDAIY